MLAISISRWRSALDICRACRPRASSISAHRELGQQLRHSHRRPAALSAQPGDAGGKPHCQHRLFRCDGHSAASRTAALAQPGPAGEYRAHGSGERCFCAQVHPAGLDPTTQSASTTTTSRRSGRGSSASPATCARTSTSPAGRARLADG